jgi:hypothetical protein
MRIEYLINLDKMIIKVFNRNNPLDVHNYLIHNIKYIKKFNTDKKYLKIYSRLQKKLKTYKY